MNDQARKALSKYLSFLLRHQPEAAGLTLDEAGWVDVERLVEGAAANGRAFSRDELEEIVATNAKRRFAFSDDGLRIRATQGHSVDVELGYEEVEPPALLFHGTVTKALDAIRAEGLRRMQRHHVHLSADETTAREVGGRRGRPVVLRIDAAAMSAAGHTFYLSANGVWLTDAVPPAFILDLAG